MNTKTNVTVYLNVELANLGKEMGLNLSKVCENALKTAINRLQGFNAENNGVQGVSSAKSYDEWTERDLNRNGFKPVGEIGTVLIVTGPVGLALKWGQNQYVNTF